jgi:hypothetical protein
MKLEQKIVAAYLMVGLVCGILSNYLASINLTYALLVPLGIYFVTLVPLVKVVKERRFRMLISNSLVTFFLVWVMAWVFLYNL